jgi:hypothetical protein
MTTSPAVSSLATPAAPPPAHLHHRRDGGFDQQLRSATASQVAQTTAGALTGAAAPGTAAGGATGTSALAGTPIGTAAGAGTLLAGDLLMQIQNLPGRAAATPTG